MNCKERLTMHTSEGACLIINANNEIDARQELYDKFKLACNKLAELEDKLENGTLIELPCKVGDTVYELIHCISSTNQKKYRIRQSTVKSIYYNQGENEESIVLIYVSVNRRLSVLNKKAFGFSAFLTKEKAETRLKELQNG